VRPDCPQCRCLSHVPLSIFWAASCSTSVSERAIRAGDRRYGIGGEDTDIREARRYALILARHRFDQDAVGSEPACISTWAAFGSRSLDTWVTARPRCRRQLTPRGTTTPCKHGIGRHLPSSDTARLSSGNGTATTKTHGRCDAMHRAGMINNLKAQPDRFLLYALARSASATCFAISAPAQVSDVLMPCVWTLGTPYPRGCRQGGVFR
jgi:hypothetical protein